MECPAQPLGQYADEEELLPAHLQSSSSALTVFQLQQRAGLPETADARRALLALSGGQVFPSKPVANLDTHTA